MCIFCSPVSCRWRACAGDGWTVRKRCLEGWSPSLWTCPRCSVASQSSEYSCYLCQLLLSRPMSPARRWIPTENPKYILYYLLLNNYYLQYTRHVQRASPNFATRYFYRIMIHSTYLYISNLIKFTYFTTSNIFVNPVGQPLIHFYFTKSILLLTLALI